jgi:hypothetical protein
VHEKRTCSQIKSSIECWMSMFAMLLRCITESEPWVCQVVRHPAQAAQRMANTIQYEGYDHLLSIRALVMSLMQKDKKAVSPDPLSFLRFSTSGFHERFQSGLLDPFIVSKHILHGQWFD